jgi:hypothetical protein
MSATLETNRANAQHSTGPKTEEEKQKSSLNALRHGLTGQIVVMPGEDLSAYQLHLKSFKDEYQPKNTTESTLVQVLAETEWCPAPRSVSGNESPHARHHATDSLRRRRPEQIVDALAIASALEKQCRAFSNLSSDSSACPASSNAPLSSSGKSRKPAEPRKPKP